MTGKNSEPDTFRDRIEGIDIPHFDDWLACPNCERFDTVRGVKDPMDGEFSIECTECGESTVIIWGDTIDLEE